MRNCSLGNTTVRNILFVTCVGVIYFIGLCVQLQISVLEPRASASASASASAVVVAKELKLQRILRSKMRDIPLWGCACVAEAIVPLIRAKRALENSTIHLCWSARGSGVDVCVCVCV